MITAGLITLVLEEDGTVVDTEEFFQSLGENTHFMLLKKGQKWTLVSIAWSQAECESSVSLITCNLTAIAGTLYFRLISSINEDKLCVQILCLWSFPVLPSFSYFLFWYPASDLMVLLPIQHSYWAHILALVPEAFWRLAHTNESCYLSSKDVQSILTNHG